MTRASTIGRGVAGKRAAAREHLAQHAAERPDVGALVDQLCRAPARAHVCGRAERSHRAAVASTVVGDRGRQSTVERESCAMAFATPKSSTLTDPSGAILMFAGLRSR